MNWDNETGRFALGDFAVEKGGVIRDAHLAWQRFGTLNAKRDNLILYPSSYSARLADMSWLVGPDGILDPTRWCIIAVAMFSNGESSGAAETPDYPRLVTMADNVRAQHRLVTEMCRVDKLAGVYGFSMGGMQAYHWAALYPDMVERAFVVCGSARTADHNKVFLSGLLRTLEAAPERTGSGLSQDFYRAGLYKSVLGAPDLETFVRINWAERFSQCRAANLYAQAHAWFHGDISDNALYHGDLARALRSIKARVLLMPSETDLYFRVADNAAELPYLGSGALRPIPSIWGHRAGNPSANPADAAFLKTQVADLLG